MSSFNESGHPREGCLYVEKQDDKVKYRIQLAGEVTEGVLDIRIYTEGSTISNIADYAHTILNKTAILGHSPKFNLHYFWEQLEKKLQLGCSDSIESLALYCTSKNNLDLGYRLDEHNQLRLYLMEDWIKFLHELGHAVARLKGEAFTESQNLPTELRHYNNVEEYLNICVRQWSEHVMEHPDIRRVGHKIRGFGEIKSLSFKTIYDKFIGIAQFDDSQEQVPMELKYREFMMQRERSQSDVSNEERKSYFRPI